MDVVWEEERFRFPAGILEEKDVEKWQI